MSKCKKNCFGCEFLTTLSDINDGEDPFDYEDFDEWHELFCNFEIEEELHNAKIENAKCKGNFDEYDYGN